MKAFLIINLFLLSTTSFTQTFVSKPTDFIPSIDIRAVTFGQSINPEAEAIGFNNKESVSYSLNDGVSKGSDGSTYYYLNKNNIYYFFPTKTLLDDCLNYIKINGDRHKDFIKWRLQYGKNYSFDSDGLAGDLMFTYFRVESGASSKVGIGVLDEELNPSPATTELERVCTNYEEREVSVCTGNLFPSGCYFWESRTQDVCTEWGYE